MRRCMVPIVGLAALAGVASAQESAGPPKVLVIAREEIKPGKMGSHEKVAARFVSLLSRVNSSSYRLGLVPVSGDDNQVVYLEGYPSFAELEASRKQFETTVVSNAAFKTELDQLEAQGDMHATQNTTLARLREDLSYHPRGTSDVAQARFMSVRRILVKPGRTPDLVEYVKTLNAARDKANAEWVHTAVYQAISGAPVGTFGTFFVFGINKSLKEWDDNFAKMEERNKAIDAALGGEEVVKQRRKLISEIVAEDVTTLYAMKPTISRPSEQLAAHDPDFWRPQPVGTGKALAIKKETQKTRPKE